jgi:pSer/pThr/pTyr-binding forkhead associated (FHA) protein
VFFKVDIDYMTAERILDAQGALMTPAGTVTIILPAEGPVVIGAAAQHGCDVVIDDDRISGQHLMLEAVQANDDTETDAHVAVTDLQSTNGVYRNSTKLQAFKTVMADVHDEIVIGQSAISRFRIAEATHLEAKARTQLLCMPSLLSWVATYVKLLLMHVQQMVW